MKYFIENQNELNEFLKDGGNHEDIKELCVSGDLLSEEMSEEIEKMVNLVSLYMYETWAFDAPNLTNLTKLEVLDIGYNTIREIKGLEKLPNLKKLNMEDNPFEESEKNRIADIVPRFCRINF